MMLTPLQQRIVEENMGLVAKVIKDKVHGLSQPGHLPTKTCTRLVASACVKQLRPTKVDASPPMHID